MEANTIRVDEYYYEFWNKHYVKLGGMERVKQYQFKFKLLPNDGVYNGENYVGFSKLKEIILKEEKMNGESFFCINPPTHSLMGVDGLALAKKFTAFNELIGDESYNEKDIKEYEAYFFIAYVFTLEKDLPTIKFNNKNQTK